MSQRKQSRAELGVSIGITACYPIMACPQVRIPLR
jgi:hypothetical protein